MGGACGAPRLSGVYLISKMYTKIIQKLQKAYIKTYEEDVNIYKDIENSQGQGGFFFENTGRALYEQIQKYIQKHNKYANTHKHM